MLQPAATCRASWSPTNILLTTFISLQNFNTFHAGGKPKINNNGLGSRGRYCENAIIILIAVEWIRYSEFEFEATLWRKDTKTQFYKEIATLVLTHGSKTWSLSQKEKQRVQATEMRYLRRMKGWRIRNHRYEMETYGLYNICSVNDGMQQKKENWIQYINRMVNKGPTKKT